MNRLLRASPAPVRGRIPAVVAAQLLLRQGKPKDESLDLFSAIPLSESPTISSPAVAEEGVLGRAVEWRMMICSTWALKRAITIGYLHPLELLSFPHAMELNTNHLQLLQKALQKLDQL
ncbi:uncharacterized protein LOC109724260 [Ananas comosus]|uniref:Uncharacterized protein LOC109724260 n=1 Tax=Ananas comosus TaxID=4615 RepID=A0A6P5GKV3_ANACO|nr:uncharacterized protein LOC109724260 [Ananas comosus]